jgi:hypothetical protein
MAVEFHEMLLNVEYAPGSQGGPSFANGLLGAPSRVIQVSSNSLKDLWKGGIDFSLLRDDQLERLYSFFLCRGGNRCGFRLLPPKFNQAKNSLLAATLVDVASLKLYAEWTDGFYTYRKRIVKPAWGASVLTLNGEYVGHNNEAGVYQRPVFGGVSWGEIEPALVVNLDYTAGIITPVGGTLPAGEWRWSGEIHLPVIFTSGDFEGRYDVSSQWGNIGIQELLPKSLGLS